LKEAELQARSIELDKKSQELKELESRLQLLEIDLCAKLQQIEEKHNGLQETEQKENSVQIVDTTMFSSPVATPGSKFKRRESRYSDVAMISPIVRGRVFQLKQEKF
jgi:hypothetical protein